MLDFTLTTYMIRAVERVNHKVNSTGRLQALLSHLTCLRLPNASDQGWILFGRRGAVIYAHALSLLLLTSLGPGWKMKTVEARVAFSRFIFEDAEQCALQGG